MLRFRSHNSLALKSFYCLIVFVIVNGGQMDKSTIKSLLIENKKLLQDYGIKKIGLFGSYLHQTETAESDIDLLVDADDKMTLLRFSDLEIKLTEIFGHKIDLVSINGISKYIKPTVFNEVEFFEDL